jgi:uncharacterized membrane protein
MRIENSIEIEAPPARVWELTVDVESWPELTSTISRIERLDTALLDVESKARVEQPGQMARIWTVTALEPGRRFAWSTQAFGATITATHLLRPSEAGTTNTLVVEVEGRLSALIGALVRRPIAKAIETENRGFKAAAEQ